MAIVIASACSTPTTDATDTTAVGLPWDVQPAATVDDGDAYWPAQRWRTALPAQVAIDSAPMATLSRDLRRGRWPTVRSFVVVRHGYVVLEEHLAGTTPETLHLLQSVTKTVTGLLVGIAQDEQRLRASDNVSSLFPEYADLFGADAAKRAMTIDDLLAMRSGLDFYEEPYEGSPLQTLNNSRGDWLRIIFSRPMNAEPGAQWRYNSGGIIALGGALYATTGEAADVYARHALFAPLGITRFGWFTGQPNGLPHMGGGLTLTSTDAARIGYLLLRRGRWNGTPVVSAAWIDRMREHRTTGVGGWAGHSLDYGRTLWLMALPGDASGQSDPDVITASGSGGQWIFVVPAKDLVVVATGDATRFDDFALPIRLLFETILPATR